MYEVALIVSLATFVAIGFYYVRSPSFSIFHPFTIFMAVHGLIFVIRPIVGDILHYDKIYSIYQFNPSIDARTTVIVASNLSLVCFSFWCLRVGAMPMRFNFDRFDREERRRLTQVFSLASMIVLPFAIYSLYTTYSSLSQGSIVTGMVIDRASGYQYNTATNGYVTDGQMMLVPWVALIAWIGRFRPLSLVPLLLFVLVKAGTGGRGAFVVAMVSTALLYCFEHRRRLLPATFIGYGAALLALFALIGLDRGATLRQMLGQQVQVDVEEKLASGDDWKFLESMDWANMEFFEYLVYVIPERSGTYDYFLDNFQIFTDPVPRAFWEGKPKGEPFRSIFLFDYGDPVGMTRSIPGEGWYAFGWIGVIIWSSLWGAAMGDLYRRFALSKQTTMQTACYMAFVPSLIVGYRDGMLQSVVHSAGVYLAPIGVWYLLARGAAVPKADALRKAALRKLRRALAANPAPTSAIEGASPPAAPAIAEPHIPPAVRRRRAFLQSLAGKTAQP